MPDGPGAKDDPAAIPGRVDGAIGAPVDGTIHLLLSTEVTRHCNKERFPVTGRKESHSW